MLALSSLKFQPASRSASKTVTPFPETSAPSGPESTRSNVLDLRDFLPDSHPGRDWDFSRWKELADAWLASTDDSESEPESEAFEATTPKAMFRLEQQWQGVVLAIEDDVFHAELVDLTEPSAPHADASFPKNLIERGDEDLLAPGALFYFSIGQVRRAPGQPIENGHRLRFRRALWSRRDMAQLESRRARWQELLGTNDAEHATRPR